MIEIIPAIDIIEGKCVRLSQGDYNQKKIYNEDPLEVALEFEAAGLKRLHLVDLEGAKAKHVVNIKVLEKIVANTKLKIDFGGGVKTNYDIEQVFNAGASQVTAGSVAINNPDTVIGWVQKYGTKKIILGADVKDKMIAISGWQDTSRSSVFDLLTFYSKQNIEYVVCTDIAKDGMLQGSSAGLYKEILYVFPKIKLIASGGVTTVDEIKALDTVGLYGVIIGKAIYEGRITLNELKMFIE